MMAGTLVLYALAAQLQQVGQTVESGGPDAVRTDRAAAGAATWVGAISPDQTLAVSPTDRDWWVMGVCEGATVVVDLLPVGTGVVEAVLLDPELHPLARAQSAGSGGRISWIGTFDGRVFLEVGPAPDAGAPSAQYRMQAWWVDALTCPVRATASASPTSSAHAPAPPPVPPPGPPAPTAGPSAAPLVFAPATPEEPSPPSTSEPSAATRTAGPVSSVSAGVASDESSAPPPPGVHEHDGFLWRLALGVGYAGWLEESYYYEYYEDHSEWVNLAGGGLNMAFGGSLNEALYLYTDFNLNFPQVFGIGVGFGAYLGDNWFVDAAIGYHLLACGYLAVTAGKEWWVGEQWLTGLSIRWTAGTGWIIYDDAWVTSVILNWSLTYS